MASYIRKDCDSNQAVTITFLNPVKVTVNAQLVMVFPLTERKTLRFDSALLSAQKDTITLRGRSSQVATVMSVQGGNVKLRFSQNGQMQEQEISAVQGLTVGAAGIEIAAAQAPVPNPGHTVPVTDPAPNTADQPNAAALVRENERLKQQCAKAVEIMNGQDRTIRAMQNENAGLAAELAGLKQAVAAGLDQILQDLRSGQQPLSQELQKKVEEIARLHQESEALREQITRKEGDIAAASAHLQELQGQLGVLQGQEETTTLDCEAVSAELEALRTRLQLNGDIVTLTESRWLKNNSVTETMEELEKKMDAVEARIGFILNARELYGRTVQSAVLMGGDGTISVHDESGNPAQPQNNTEPTT